MDQRKKNKHNTNHLDQEKIRDLQLTCRSKGGKKENSIAQNIHQKEIRNLGLIRY